MIPVLRQIIIHPVNRGLNIQHIAGLSFYYLKLAILTLQRIVHRLDIISGALICQNIIDRLKVKAEQNRVNLVLMLEILQNLISLNHISVRSDLRRLIDQLRVRPRYSQLSGCDNDLITGGSQQRDLGLPEAFYIFLYRRLRLFSRHSGQLYIPCINAGLYRILLRAHAHAGQHDTRKDQKKETRSIPYFSHNHPHFRKCEKTIHTCFSQIELIEEIC